MKRCASESASYYKRPKAARSRGRVPAEGISEPGVFRVEVYSRGVDADARVRARMHALAARFVPSWSGVEPVLPEPGGGSFTPVLRVVSEDASAEVVLLAMHDVLVVALALNSEGGITDAPTAFARLRDALGPAEEGALAACDVFVGLGPPPEPRDACALVGYDRCLTADLEFGTVYIFDRRAALLVSRREDEESAYAYLTNTLPVVMVVAARLEEQIEELVRFAGRFAQLASMVEVAQEARGVAYRQVNSLLRLFPTPARPGSDADLRAALSPVRRKLASLAPSLKGPAIPEERAAELDDMPFPIAFSYHLIERVYPNRNRFLRVIDFINATVTYVALLALAAAREHTLVSQQIVIPASDLPRLAAGMLKSLVARTARSFTGATVRPFISDLAKLTDSSAAMRELAWLTNFRNRTYGHAASHLDDGMYHSLTDEARPHVDRLLGELRFLSRCPLMWIESRNETRAGTVRVLLQHLSGASRHFRVEERILEAPTTRFYSQDVCVQGDDGAFRSLHPLIRFDPCEACGGDGDLFLLARVTDGRAAYLSYQDGQSIERDLNEVDIGSITGRQNT